MYSFSLIISVTRSLSVWSWKTTSTWTPSVNISAPPAMSPFLDNSVTPWEWPWQKIRWWMKSRKGLLSLELSLWDSRSLFRVFFENQLFKIFSGHPCRHINPDHGQRGRLDRKEKAFHLPPLRLHCLQRQLLVQLVPHGLLLVSLNQASGRFWLLYLCLGWFSSQILFLWWMIFEAIHEFLGGRHVITVVAVLYITDITSVESRWQEFLRMVIV